MRAKTGHGLKRALADECSCAQCEFALTRARDLAQAYREGKSLAEIGREEGLSHERVRQILMAFEPDLITKMKHAREKEARYQRQLRIQAEMEARTLAERPCEVCGAGVSPRRRTCGGDCSRLWTELRYLADPEQYERWRDAMLVWHKTQRGKDYQRRPDERRWLQEGSVAWRAVLEAKRRGLPIYDRLPEPIRRQVEESVRNGFR